MPTLARPPPQGTFAYVTSFKGDLNRWNVSQVTSLKVRLTSRPADCARERA